MKFPKNAVYAQAKKRGCKVEWGEAGSVFTIRVDAPALHHFKEGVHCLVEESRVGSALDRDNMWITMLARLNQGVDECDLNDDDCISANDL